MGMGPTPSVGSGMPLEGSLIGAIFTGSAFSLFFCVPFAVDFKTQKRLTFNFQSSAVVVCIHIPSFKNMYSSPSPSPIIARKRVLDSSNHIAFMGQPLNNVYS